MKKLFLALAAIATLVCTSCTKNEENTPNNEETTLKGRWDAPRAADMPDDIAFVALFGDTELDLYIIAWGQHLKGTYTWNNDVVTYNITEANQAYTNVTYDDEGHMATWEWMAGNLDAGTLTLASGYEWYPMSAEELARANEDFGSFAFKVDGTTATSTLVGIENLTFNKVN